MKECRRKRVSSDGTATMQEDAAENMWARWVGTTDAAETVARVLYHADDLQCCGTSLST